MIALRRRTKSLMVDVGWFATTLAMVVIPWCAMGVVSPWEKREGVPAVGTVPFGVECVVTLAMEFFWPKTITLVC